MEDLLYRILSGATILVLVGATTAFLCMCSLLVLGVLGIQPGPVSMIITLFLIAASCFFLSGLIVWR
jgi:hypothetical protein